MCVVHQCHCTAVETDAGVAVAFVPEPMDGGVNDIAAGGKGQPGLKLQVETEYEGSACCTFLIVNDDDD
jgi:hypothetical protein